MARAPFRRVAAPFARWRDLFARWRDLFARWRDLFARWRDLFARSPAPSHRYPAPFAMVLVNERRVPSPGARSSHLELPDTQRLCSDPAPKEGRRADRAAALRARAHDAGRLCGHRAARAATDGRREEALRRAASRARLSGCAARRAAVRIPAHAQHRTGAGADGARGPPPRAPRVGPGRGAAQEPALPPRLERVDAHRRRHRERRKAEEAFLRDFEATEGLVTASTEQQVTALETDMAARAHAVAQLEKLRAAFARQATRSTSSCSSMRPRRGSTRAT